MAQQTDTSVKSPNWNRTSVVGIAAALIVGVLIALAGSDGSSKAGSVSVFLICGVVAYLINWLVFIPSYQARTEHYYDLTGSITYLTLTILALVLSGDVDTRAVIVSVLVIIWASRLGSFLFARVKRDGRDGRFDRIKTDFLRFFMMWSVQALWVFLTLACALAIITGAERESLGVIGIIGIAVWVVGFAIEVVSDQQKSNFRKDPANDGRFITTGLWAWSRHPNYFGEIVLWTGIAIIALPVLSGWRWVTLISPVFVVVLLTRVSGLPMLEARAKKRWGKEAAFQTYVKNTPVLIPKPPSR